MKTKKNQTSGSGVSTWQAGVFLFFLWDIQSLRSRWIGSSFPVFVAGNGRGVVVLIVVDVVVVIVVVCIALVFCFVFFVQRHSAGEVVTTFVAAVVGMF